MYIPNRRSFIVSSAGLAALSLGETEQLLAEPTEPESDQPLGQGFPAQDPELVREIVGVSHGNFERVRELVTAHPALAKASWDWGFGDWESALGAASHTGSREIAELLIENGARVNIFSAAMLGQLAVVKAFVEAAPGIQRTPGPHGIPLLIHAKLGGEPAAEVLKYLESLGDAGGSPSMPLDEEQKAVYVGEYAVGSGGRIKISDNKGRLMFQYNDGAARGLSYLGDHSFHPAGAPAVRVKFNVSGNQATDLTLIDSTPQLKALRR